MRTEQIGDESVRAAYMILWSARSRTYVATVAETDYSRLHMAIIEAVRRLLYHSLPTEASQ